MGLPSERRIHSSRDFTTVFKRGSRASDGVLTLVSYKARPCTEPNRFGLSVGKRVGPAVRRNQVKRILREVLRDLPAIGGRDTVVHTLLSSATADYWDLRHSLISLGQRVGLVGVKDQLRLQRKLTP